MNVNNIKENATEWGILGGLIGTALGSLAGVTYGVCQEINLGSQEKAIRELIEADDDMDLGEDSDNEEEGDEFP